jgi:hypothetical protein
MKRIRCNNDHVSKLSKTFEPYPTIVNDTMPTTFLVVLATYKIPLNMIIKLRFIGTPKVSSESIVRNCEMTNYVGGKFVLKIYKELKYMFSFENKYCLYEMINNFLCSNVRFKNIKLNQFMILRPLGTKPYQLMILESKLIRFSHFWDWDKVEKKDQLITSNEVVLNEFQDEFYEYTNRTIILMDFQGFKYKDLFVISDLEHCENLSKFGYDVEELRRGYHRVYQRRCEVRTRKRLSYLDLA